MSQTPVASLPAAPAESEPGRIALVAVALFACFAVWSTLMPPFTAPWQNFTDDAGFLPFRLILTYQCFELGMRMGTPRRVARAWQLLGYSFLVGVVGNVLRLAGHAGIPFPEWVRLAVALPQGALMLAGLWRLTPLRAGGDRTSDWFDAAVLVLSGFILTAHFVANGTPFTALHLGLTRWVFLFYLLVDLVAVFFTTAAWFRRPAGVSRDALALLTAAFAVIAFVDMEFDQAIQQGTWHNGGMIDLTVTFAFTLLVFALDRQSRFRTRAATDRQADRPGRHIVAPAAILAATLPLLMLAWSPEHDNRRMPFLVTGVSILLALVLIRQHLARRLAAREAAARAAADARFRSLVQRSSDAIFQVAPDHTIQWASPSAGQLTGTIPSLLAGRRISELAHPEDRDRLTVFLANAGEPFSRNAVLRWRLGRGETWHDVESVVSDLTGDVAVGALVLNTRDVSERVRLEQQLRQAQKLEAVGRLAGGIAHDFNNILAAIITHAHLVRDMLPTDDERARDLLEIEQTAQRGAALTRRLLSFSRPDAGELRAQALTHVVRGMEPMLRRLLVSQVELWLDLGDRDLWVRTAEGQLEQILMNLAINARDAMPDGGVVRVNLRETIVQHGDGASKRGVLPGRWAELTVTDEGVGMDAATLSRLFEPFFTTKPTGLGTGLGLATVRGIVRSLGGHVSADSSPGRGTTMRVLLPLASPPGAPPSDPVRAPSISPTAAGKPVVLVVDDEVSLRNAMERFLNRHGYHVLAAGSALEAIDMLENRNWAVDLVITDMVMPRMSGKEFVRHLRDRAPGIPVLCVSGHVGWEADETEDPNAPWGPERLLAKPFPFPEFLRRVRETLGAGVATA